MKKKVLFIITSVNQGGLETYLLRFLEYKKNSITAIVMYKKVDVDDFFYKKFKQTNAEMIFLPITFSPISVYKLYIFLKKENITTVCDFRGDFSGLSLAISWLAKIKNRTVFYRESIHQFKSNFLKRIYIIFLNSLTKKFSTKILSNSSEAFSNFYRPNALKNKTHKVIKNGVFNRNDCIKRIDVRSNLGIPKESFVIGHVGRFTEAKNHKVIVEIAKILCKEDNNIYFLLCGRGVQKGIQADVVKYDLNNNIISPGLCQNIPSYLDAMDLFIFPSINEGQPNALIEAMNAGIPIIASDIPSIKETVRSDMKNVLFLPNSVEGFVSKIEEVKRGELGYNIEEIKEWSKEEYGQIKRFEEFYEELL